MMKITKFFFLILFFCFFTLSVHADELNPLIYQYLNPEVTVVFSEPLQVSPERQQSIADEIAGIAPNTISNPNVYNPENIICTIFGHNLEGPVIVTATHHKAKKYHPRCLMEEYHVVYCTRCDYSDMELYDSFYIICCPED